MFEIVYIIATRVLLVLFGYWVYRKLSGWSGFHEILFGRRGSLMKVARAGQKGFVGVKSQGDKRKHSVKKNHKNEVKEPWGW